MFIFVAVNDRLKILSECCYAVTRSKKKFGADDSRLCTSTTLCGGAYAVG